MQNFAHIQGIIDEYIELLEKLTIFEQQKLEAVSTKATEQLDNFLKEEQVYLLQLRGLDQKREKLQKDSGLEGLTYRQIIDKAQGTERTQLETSYEILSARTKVFKQTINTLKSYIDIRLHSIDEVRERFGAPAPNTAQQDGIYNQIGSKPDTISHNSGKFQSTKV